MPYEWTENTDACDLHVWPNRSLTKRGFKLFMGITATLISLPLLAVLGTAVLWALLPFVALTMGLLWLLIERNDKDLSILEHLRIQPDTVALIRNNPRSPAQTWDCNTYWASLQLHPDDGPVPNYLTLSGNGREVELGAFLSEEERVELFAELQDRLNTYRTQTDA